MKYSEIKHCKYILREDFRIKIPGIPDEQCHNDYISLDHGNLIIKYSYAWDGSSIPLKKWYSWIWDSDKYCKTASLVHDAFCQLMQAGMLDKKYKAYVDGFYKYMCMLGGMGKHQANMRYWFLRKSGTRFLRKKRYPRGRIISC